MSDVLAFTVPTFPGGGTKYPSVNMMWEQGVRYGKKTPEYHDLFDAIRQAAGLAMIAVGWETTDDRVEVHLRRYVVDLRQRDAANMGKVELDAMAPWKKGQPRELFPGVYRNDHQVRPFFDVTFDPTPDAIDRIAIAVFRLFTPAVGKRPKAAPKPPRVAVERAIVPTGPVPLLDGKPISFDQARDLIGRS